MKSKTSFLCGLILLYACIIFHPALAQEKAIQPKINLSNEIMGELACYCGCRLPASRCEGNMNCPEAKKLKTEVDQLLEQGKTREEVLQAMVKKYGESILAAPPKKGFDLLAWVLPFVALLMGGFVVAMVLKKLIARPTTQQAETPVTSARKEKKFPSELEKRFEQELKNFKD